MKRNFLSLFLVVLLVLPLAILAGADTPEQFVYDDANLLTVSQLTALEQQLEYLSMEYDTQIVVATVPTANGRDVSSLTREFYHGQDLGYGPNQDGILLLVCMDPREMRVFFYGSAEYIVTDSDVDDICDAVAAHLSDGDYADAFAEFADQCEYYLHGDRHGFPFPFAKNLLICLIIGIAVGLITVLILKGQLKSVKKQSHANVYVKDNSMHLTTRSDLYLYRNVTKTKRETSSSSSGSRSGGGGRMGGRSF